MEINSQATVAFIQLGRSEHRRGGGGAAAQDAVGHVALAGRAGTRRGRATGGARAHGAANVLEDFARTGSEVRAVVAGGVPRLNLGSVWEGIAGGLPEAATAFQHRRGEGRVFARLRCDGIAGSRSHPCTTHVTFRRVHASGMKGPWSRQRRLIGFAASAPAQVSSLRNHSGAWGRTFAR